MPMPARHVQQLDALIGRHRSSIRQLRTKLGRVTDPAEIARLRRAMRYHESAVDLGTDPQVRAALDELHDDPAQRAIAKRDPKAFARAKGIRLPPGSRLTLREFSPRWSIGYTSVDDDGTEHFTGYDSEDGWVKS